MIDTSHIGIAPPGTYETILKLIRPIRGLRILDIPCGTGGFVKQMRSEGAICFGVDLDASAACTSIMVANINDSLPFANESFDVITCVEGVEHVHDAFYLMQECHRLLRPGGRLILSTPNLQNLRSRIKFLLRGTFFWFDTYAIRSVGHINIIPFFLLKHILKTAGFSQISVQANRKVFPYLPISLSRLIQIWLSGTINEDMEQNSDIMLNAEGLIVFAVKQ